MPDCIDAGLLRDLLHAVQGLIHDTEAGSDAHAAAIAAVPAARRASAVNLAQYLAVRTHDLRPLQQRLADLSLSSLGRMEANVQCTLHGVRTALFGLLGEAPREAPPLAAELTSRTASALLEQHTAELLGPPPASRRTRIMVTLPSGAANDRRLLRDLLLAGMDVVRINLAHDGEAAWTAMVENVRGAVGECGRSCRVLADLPGPKLRTGALWPGPRVVRVRPRRDELGIVVEPAHAVFRDAGTPAAAGGVEVPLDAPFAALASPGDEVVVIDTRGRRRRFVVQAGAGGAVHATTDRTAYLGTGCEVELQRGGETVARSRIGELPPLPSFVPLQVGDRLLVAREPAAARPAAARAGGDLEPPRVPCTLPEVFAAVRAGERILFDDGRLAGVVEANDGAELRVRITEAPPGGARLRAEKGINLPDTDLHLSALTPHDLACLDWVASHADSVGMSFVQRAADVLRLHGELAARRRPDLGIVLKIETAKAFQRLPELLFAGLRSPPLGVMVARGDLAVEVGYARLAEVQEEILWLCEAAHLPVIWATQVLDSMARTGVPSRAEVTDAGMGVRAECVMLNKGPYIAATTRFLGGVLERMQEHHAKKRSMLRALRVAGVPHGLDGG